MRPKHKAVHTRAARFALRHSLTRYALPDPHVEAYTVAGTLTRTHSQAPDVGDIIAASLNGR